MAVIVVVPFETAVIFPFELTVATFGLLDSHEIVPCSEPSGIYETDNVSVFPTHKVEDVLFNEIDSSGFTVIVYVLEKSPKLAVNVAVPADIPFTVPFAFTVNIAGSEDVHFTSDNWIGVCCSDQPLLVILTCVGEIVSPISIEFEVFKPVIDNVTGQVVGETVIVSVLWAVPVYVAISVAFCWEKTCTHHVDQKK